MVSNTTLLVAGIGGLALVPLAVMMGLAGYLSSANFFALFGWMVAGLLLAFVGIQSLLAWRRRRSPVD